MFKKALFTGLILILSANAAFSALVSPDSVFGNFTKCTVRYSTVKTELSPYEKGLLNGGYDKTKVIYCEAVYDNNRKIISEFAKYDDGSPKQSIHYKYDDNGSLLEISLYNKDGALFVNQKYIKSKDTLRIRGYLNTKGSDSLLDQTFIYDNSQKDIPHITMDNNGDDGDYQSLYHFIRGSDTHISIYINPVKNYKYLSLSKTSDYQEVNKYDKEGRIIETTRTDPDGEVNVFYNKYDLQGRLLESGRLMPDGSETIQTFFKYEDDGTKTEYNRDYNNQKYLQSISRFDKAGRLFEQVVLWPQNGKVKSSIIRKFDDKNRIIEINRVNPKDEGFVKSIYEYDDYGNCTRKTTYTRDNEILNTIEYAYSK